MPNRLHMPLCKMWWVKNEASLRRSEKGENIFKIQVRVRLLEGKGEEDDRPKDRLHGQKCGGRKLFSGDWDKKSPNWEMYATE